MVAHKAQLTLASGINVVVITAAGLRWLWVIALFSKKLSATPGLGLFSWPGEVKSFPSGDNSIFQVGDLQPRTLTAALTCSH